MIRVALADDHKLFREGVRFLLRNMDGLELVLEASDGVTLLEAIPAHKPDVLLLDLDMPKMDGVEVLKRLRLEKSDLGVIILTMHNDNKLIAYLMELGANGYLLKDIDREELEQAISSVYHEGFYFNKQVSHAMLGGLKSHNHKKPRFGHNVVLTNREIEVLELICQELTAKEIADKLFISPRTAEVHRKNLISKMGVRNTAGLIVKAIKQGIIDV